MTRAEYIEKNGDKEYITNKYGKEFTRNEYLEFLYNEKNIGQCDICPEYSGDNGWCGNLPCGQQHCFVRLHCEANKRYEER